MLPEYEQDVNAELDKDKELELEKEQDKNNYNDDYLLEENDIVFARTGASTGKTYLYNPNDGDLYFAGFLIKFHIKDANARFVFYQTCTHEYEKWVHVMSTRSGQPGINSEEYSTLKIKLPCIEEQQKIADYLDKKCSAIDSAIAKKQAIIEKLTAYKKSLIYEYVTGKKEAN